ncbi:response regulator transcription factor [Microbacterium sp.]|uniref:response regulator n=1 Tax=Microbacterium sp. TaxID=51671 RepID=UPI00092B360E|nr:response regulator transcription factor [Microbacterium sp.]MBN9191611.1 response regulator transcription factor [Microbacterium sp.]OJU69396.1 MAG: DNA-binding response regulator [Microbacterium sp. 70-38]
MTRVFLVDDHEIVRRGLADLLSAQHDIEIVGEAGTVAQARRRIPATSPDVAVLDVRLPDGSGIDLCRELAESAPDVRRLILTAYDDDAALFAAVVAGASGYLLKSVLGSQLVDGVRAVAAGTTLIDPELAARATKQMRDAPHTDDPRIGSLGLRERQVLALIADGLSNRQIGERLGLAEKTVKNYVSSLLTKLGLERRTQAAVFGVRYAP